MSAYLTSQTGGLIGHLSSEGSLTGRISTTLPDGGYERGYSEGYDEALEKRTVLVITENGEYAPTDGSTGFKQINVQVENKLVSMVEGNIIQVTAADLYGATQIRSRAFYSFNSLQSVEIPSTVKTIGEEAFRNCAKLSSIQLSEGLETIGAYAFMWYLPITNLAIPSTVKTIGHRICEYDRALETVIVKATIPPTAGSELFANCSKLKKIVVPRGSGATYKSATNWSLYADKIVEGDV